MKLVERVRTGSRNVWHETTPKHGYHSIEEDYTTIIHDCIPGKAWLKAHYQDVIPEPTIEIKVDGKNLSVNGNYKAGIIKEFMGHFCYPGEGKIRLVSVKNAIAAERRLRREFIKERSK